VNKKTVLQITGGTLLAATGIYIFKKCADQRFVE